MTRQAFEDQMDVLHRKMMTMGKLVEEAIHKSIKSLVERDVQLAEEVIANDKMPAVALRSPKSHQGCVRLRRCARMTNAAKASAA